MSLHSFPINGYFTQGTWQFISIARLQDPSSRQHEVSDDLESFFWVLLYLIAKCMKPGRPDISQQMQLVFDQFYDMDDDGITRGGRGKLGCLREGGDLDSEIVEELVETPCKDIVEELRSLFQDSYRHVRPMIGPRPEAQEKIRRKREEDEKVRNALRKLRSSEEVLAIISNHLASGWGVDDDDGSHYTVAFRPDPPEASGGRRERKAEDEGFANLNDRRRNRFPPRSTQPSQSKDMLGLQGHRSSFGSGAGYD